MLRTEFEGLVKRIRPKLKAITRKLDGKYTVFSYDDLYQEAFLYLWDKYKSGELPSDTDSFILQGCYFFLKNYIRKSYKKIDRKSLSFNNTISDNGNTSFDEIYCLAGKEEIIGSIGLNLLIEDIYKLITAREQEVFSLVSQNISIREIGKKLGVSHVMVIKIKKSIQGKCRELIEEIIPSN